jgi:hypothetical protein
MPACPPKAVQAIAAVLIPCACREEVLGDLQERCIWMLLLQAALWTGHSSLALPLWIVVYGGALGLLLTSALRLLFSPPSTSPQGRI